ncbi:uncharacterized protein LOC132705090 [Cylas formicarius]|uniref:uncharacterized protein LOC132705090 n=1 Tax=Cylas formicarius TaxID=197179 RepID=UPI002958A8CA|nr:uncharacterized protein LOC132705090 [Cylas formicarius]
MYKVTKTFHKELIAFIYHPLTQIFVFKILRAILLVWSILIWLNLFSVGFVRSECRINPLQLKPAPLVLNGANEIIYPDPRSYSAAINQSERITISCPRNRVVVNGITESSTISAKCISDELFEMNNEQMYFRSVKCLQEPQETVRYTQRKCAQGNQELEIGYDLGGDWFVTQIRVCFDNVNLTPVYSHYTLKGTIAYRDSTVANPFFRDTGFYTTSRNIAELYRRDSIRNAINTLVGLSPSSEKYVERRGDLFVNRGHLAAKGDFVYAFEQLATFNYVNAAPQWASFNGGNWNEVEISVRNYASRLGDDLEIYTGVYGTTSLPHETHGRNVGLYLDINSGHVMPIPELFWKVIYNPKTKQGIVVIGLNNPYETSLSNSIICPDVSAKITWFSSNLSRNQRNVTLGYIYACTVADFTKVVNSAPNLNVHSVLI